MSELARILPVEDDPRDVELTLTALGEYNLAKSCRRILVTASRIRRRLGREARQNCR